MSNNQDNSKDKDSEDDKQISLIEEKNRSFDLLNKKRISLTNNNDKNNENLDSESDEYYEEEDEEEGEEIEDDEDDLNSEFSRRKKRKLEEKKNYPVWSRKKSENMVEENECSLSSADIVINEPENKDKNKTDVHNKEKITTLSIFNEPKLHNINKKTNFFTTPINISGSSGLNISNSGEQRNQNQTNVFNINNDFKDKNQNIVNNSNYNIKLYKSEQYSNANNLNNSEDKKNINFILPENKLISDSKKNITSVLHQPSSVHQQNKLKINIPEIFNGYKLNALIKEKLAYKYNLKNITVPELEKILFFLQDKLKIYLKIYLSRLITISRIRNVNFNLYSNNPNGQIHYKFKTYNWVVENEKNATFSPGKIFDILFTSNFKKKFDLIEEYVELNNKKIKFEKLSSCKEKYEESSKAKGIESSIKITDGPNPTIKLLPGRRTKKKNNTFFKEMRKKIVQTKKKEDLFKQKSFTKNTLDTFLNDTTNNNFQNSFTSLPNLLDGGSANKLDLSSRMSDTLSHNNYSYTNNYVNNSAQNEISMNVFTYFEPTKDGKIYGRQKKRINIKDFIFLLENSNEFIPNKLLLLNEAAIDNTKNK